ncbi:MAG: tripartite tricarboxylate transporter substrate binding protein [Thermodesulfobacteriota bacterium]
MKSIREWGLTPGFTILMVVLLGAAWTTLGQAADAPYPTRPISIIVPYGAGGGPDINARLVAAYWTKKLGQPIAIVNKAGAAGALGYREISHSQPDGYTLGAMQYPNSAVLVGLKGKEAGFANEDMIPLGTFTRTPDVFATRQGSPFKTFKEFIEHAKKNPGKITVSVPGEAHLLAVVLMEQAFGVDVKPVMFKSGVEAFNTLLGGHVQTGMFVSQFAVTGKDKGIVPLALTGSTRMESLAGVPFFKDLGHDVPVDMVTLFCAPKGTPEPILKKLTTTLQELGSNPEFVEKMKGTGVGYAPLFGAEMLKYYKDTCEAFGRVLAKNKELFAK